MQNIHMKNVLNKLTYKYDCFTLKYLLYDMVFDPTDGIFLFPFPGLSTIEMLQNKLLLTETPSV